MMWQVQTLGDGTKIVTAPLSEGITMIFIRPRGPAVYINISSNEKESRLFDTKRLPIFTIDGDYVSDLNKFVELAKDFLEKFNEVLYFADDRSVGARCWAGDRITPTAEIFKFMTGQR